MTEVAVREADCSMVDAVAVESDYDHFINRLAREMDPRTITNSSTSHALSLVRAMFRHGRTHIRIFSGSMAPEVFNDAELMRAAEQFLSHGGQVKILLQSSDVCRGHSRMLAEMLKFSESKAHQVEIKKVTPSHSLSDADVHFIVTDGRAYRIETDTENHQAVASFNDVERAKKLEGLFDLAFESSSAQALQLQ